MKCWCRHPKERHWLRKDRQMHCADCERELARYFVSEHEFRPITTLPARTFPWYERPA